MSSTLSEGDSVTPRDILSLPRPAAAVANPSGTRALWPSSTFDFAAAGGKGRSEKSIYLVELASTQHEGTADAEDFSRTTDPRAVLSSLAMTDAAWLDDQTIAFLRPAVPHGEAVAQGDAGERIDHPRAMSDEAFKKKRAAWAGMDGGEGTEVWAKDVENGDEYLVGKLPVSISDLTIRQVPRSSSTVADEALLAFSATVYPDGDIWSVPQHDQEQEDKAAGSDGKVYDSLFVRHWDEWSPTAGQKKQVHYVRLTRELDAPKKADQEHIDADSDASLEDFEIVEKPSTASANGKTRRWAMEPRRQGELCAQGSQPNVVSPLKGTPLECPVGPFGGSSDFSFSATHLLFHAKDPHVNPAWHTRTQVYLVPLVPRSPADAEPRAITLGTQGACASPVLSPDGKRAAWLEMREDGYEADRHRVMIYEVATGERWGATEEWDRSPGSIVWAPSGDKLFLQTEDQGHVKVFQLDVPKSSSAATAKKPEPVALTNEHSTTSMHPLSDTSLLLTWNSLTSPNGLSLLSVAPPSSPSPSPTVELTPLASLTKHLAARKSLSRGEEFWFGGDQGQSVHGWICFPPEAEKARLARKDGVASEGAAKGKKWPLAFLCHGGPQSAWNDGWSTRWNPNAWAGHGYITVAINRTGSTGFGQEFCDKIKEDWGGAPFRDLVAGLEFVKRAYPEIDPERTAALGASYGGFMANWIQGHNDQMGFKALVCHDGVFNTANTWFATEELYFPTREFGGQPWEVPEKYAKWSPHQHIKHWKTPQLVIHGSKDYRLVESEGLSVFNTLQRLGVPSRLLIFPSENHWVLRPQNSLKWSEEVFRWIDEWTAEDKVASAPPPVRPPPPQSRAQEAVAAMRKPGYQVEYSAGLFE
ncbi:dipeptidyl-peptidase 5 [Rhodotorula paludigena]|uniref:dipeptidyl-peptidase 5 n=1 Tax=Rhodotorula paludigena TaxID=86838 RepID=UPI003181425E